ncbi:MAG: bifunctional phosphopantothenoylcysteine decarboxylase/phosphopantothenate synthase [Fimbriiglobus sp.]|jgi:phosphopantothenate-cysteine ligase/phosphopantothenoylcysteine decarboxylase/phosphopantothenate--cysteine ligase|nr:bifunctional phosphopantothenoylcysteine decarboxylase/phosphopantothenate synthase [Fimbriiglobus sp.]
MNILVTAGNTRTMIDRVRCITNVFTGRTGANIAVEAANRGHRVTLLTSHPDTAAASPNLTVKSYQTFEDLAALMAEEVTSGGYDAIVHSAAVSDYHVGGVYAGTVATGFTDVSAGKVKSSHPEIWLRLTPAPKLVDKVRTDWGFRGVLVKFKLEVGVSEEELREIAERSRLHSAADLMSANTLDGAAEWALVGAGEYTKVPRANLAAEIVNRVESRFFTSL